jgi:NADH:ubiquinone reductase (H+-translocating)
MKAGQPSARVLAPIGRWFVWLAAPVRLLLIGMTTPTRIRPSAIPVNPTTHRPQVVIVGAGFAGVAAARRLERRAKRGEIDLLLVSPADHLNYQALMPEVAAGITDPRHIAVSLHRLLRRTRVVAGAAEAVDVQRHELTLGRNDGVRLVVRWDLLLLCPGGVTRTFDIPGIERTVGLKSLVQAVNLRDHVLAQLALTEEVPAERDERCTFVVVGGGYSGSEFAAQMQLLTRRVAPRYRGLKASDPRWVLVEGASRLMPQLPAKLSARAHKVLCARGVDVRLATEVVEVTDHDVALSNGERIPTRTVVWTTGVQPSPVIASLGLPTTQGRLQVDAQLRATDVYGLFAFGDAAAVPDLLHPDALCPQTAQHAVRQGKHAADNALRLLRQAPLREYRHHDLGFVADLGGFKAVATPLGVPVSGLPAKTLTKAYHLYALPTMTNRLRVLTDWILGTLTLNQDVRLGPVSDGDPADMAPTSTPLAAPRPSALSKLSL